MSVIKRSTRMVKNGSITYNFIAQKSMSSGSGKGWWGAVKPAPPDPIMGLTEAFLKDKNPKKINVGVGAYRNSEGKPHVLSAVRKAEEKIVAAKMNKEYSPIAGIADFCKASIEMALGKDSCNLKEGSNVTAQGISGTGSLMIGMQFLSKFHQGPKVVYIPKPTWGNHKAIAKLTGLDWKEYRYWDGKNLDVDFKGLIEDICGMPEKSVIIFHAIAHNPTGMDPSMEQWKEIEEKVKSKNLMVFFDMAYQGFATGDCENDAKVVRMFEQKGHKFLLAQSFAKNMGLYGERAGAITLLCDNKEQASVVNSQLKPIIRAAYSNPPIHGARIVHAILTDSNLKELWLRELRCMANRIKSMRTKLVESLKKAGSSRDWGHILKQTGMFCYSGMKPEEVKKIIKDHSVYMTADGRIAIAAVHDKNVDDLAKAITECTKGGGGGSDC